jgi:hypothetical protein
MRTGFVRHAVLGLCGASWLLGCFASPAQTAANTPATVPVSALRELVKPQEDMAFAEVILATTGHRILPLNTNLPAHRNLHERLLSAAAEAGARARREGITAARANEAGNGMEAFVKAALRDAGLSNRTPVTTAGREQATGYPDVEILGDPPCYLELKTYSAATANTTQRSFYFSPSERPKVTRDALHLLLAFQLERTQRDGQTVFLPVGWKLISLQDLRVELKFEFNQSNRGLYGPGNAAARLGEGTVGDGDGAKR